MGLWPGGLFYVDVEGQYINGDERFLGAAFDINLVTARTTPYSTLGAMIYYLPTKDLTITLAAYDNDGLPTTPRFRYDLQWTSWLCRTGAPDNSLWRSDRTPNARGAYATGSSLARNIHLHNWCIDSC
jgi:hypothetical protein